MERILRSATSVTVKSKREQYTAAISEVQAVENSRATVGCGNAYLAHHEPTGVIAQAYAIPRQAIEYLEHGLQDRHFRREFARHDQRISDDLFPGLGNDGGSDLVHSLQYRRVVLDGDESLTCHRVGREGRGKILSLQSEDLTDLGRSRDRRETYSWRETP